MPDMNVVAPIWTDAACQVASLGRIGNLTVRLAQTNAEIEAAQRLRYHVFASEYGANGDSFDHALGLDRDVYDINSDHLIVIDQQLPGPDEGRIVGTYRLLNNERAKLTGFYSQTSFDVHTLMKRHNRRHFLELGRSCVLPHYRGKRTIELLWHGIWAYCSQYRVDVMMGTASFAGTDPNAHAMALSFLHYQSAPDTNWAVKANGGDWFSTALLPREDIDMRAALAKMPALMKGYLRVGAKFSTCAVIDWDFNCIDVLVILPRENVSARYVAHYGENADRFIA